MTSYDIYNSLRYFDSLPQVPYSSFRTNPIGLIDSPPSPSPSITPSIVRSRRSRRRSRASRVPSFYNDDLNLSYEPTQRFKYLNELYLPHTKKNELLYHFIKKYVMVEETLKMHNTIIDYAETGTYTIEEGLISNNVSVYYDNNYLNKTQKDKYNKILADKHNETIQYYNLISFIYILDRNCIYAFNHLTIDEQLTNWMRIKSQLPTLPNSLINHKCSSLIKDKLQEVTGNTFSMTLTDNMSIYVIPYARYIRGLSTNKMHICFNPELLSNTKLYFEAMLIFYRFYIENMRNICFYKVIGSNIDRDSKKPNNIAFNDFNRKMADIVIYLEHVHIETDVINYGERFRMFFLKSWKHKIVPFSKSKLLFNSSTNDTLTVNRGKYFIQYTSGAAGNTKLDCINKIINLPETAEFNGELLSPQSICRNNYKIKTGISFKKDGLKYRVDCKNSRKATKKECKKGIRNESVGRFVDSKFVTDSQGIDKHVCYDELCFY
jgi:hypothetical protein